MSDNEKFVTQERSRHGGRFSLGWSRGSPDGFMGKLTDLSDEEYARYKTCSERLALWDADRRLFSIVARNHEEFMHTLAARRRDFAARPSKYQNRSLLNGFVLEMNRLVVNYVFSLCLYTEHMGQALQERSPALLEPYRRKCSALYDAHFEYRFLVRLRNYVAHHGLPIGTILLSEGADAQGRHILEMKVLFDRDSLLMGKKWSSVRTDLEAMPVQFSVDGQLSRMMNCMIQLREWIELAEHPELLECVLAIETLIEPVRDMEGNPTIFENFDQLIDDTLRRQSGDPEIGDSKIGIQVVPLDLMAQVHKIAQAAADDSA